MERWGRSSASSRALDQFSGDGIMVFFNDPVPIPDPAVRAVNMAAAMREAAGTLIDSGASVVVI
jgi:class 3 adenylate cyclase